MSNEKLVTVPVKDLQYLIDSTLGRVIYKPEKIAQAIGRIERCVRRTGEFAIEGLAERAS